MNSIADWLPILVVAAVIVIFPILGLIWWRMEKQRTAALQQLSTEMGFSFVQRAGC